MTKYDDWVEEIRNIHGSFVGKLLGKRQLGRSMRRWED
jgi:hypothetical protein